MRFLIACHTMNLHSRFAGIEILQLAILRIFVKIQQQFFYLSHNTENFVSTYVLSSDSAVSDGFLKIGAFHRRG